MLLDYIESESGTMLSDTLHEFREADQTRLQNLCHGISQIMLSLASKPQSHIGSLRFNDDGSIILANRPLFCTNSLLESEGMARTVDKTYATTGDFVDDMLRFREEVFRAQPNAVNDEDDCRLQMLHLTFLQRWKRQLVDCDFGGPFVLQLTEFHASNIFVDDQWNIVALIDLEFVCALPPSMMYVPHWLSVDAIDEIGGYMPAFEKMHKTFMDIFQKEEGHKAGSLEHENKTRLASLIQNSWEDYSYWFYLSLTSIDLIPYCVEDHLYKKFDVKLSTDEEKQLAKQTSSAWPPGFVEQKVRDKAKYDQDVVHHFNTQHVSTTKLSADDNMM